MSCSTPLPPAAEVRGTGTALRPLLCLLAAGAVARLVLLLWFQEVPPKVWDEGDYNNIACSLVHYRQFAFSYSEPSSVASTVALAGSRGGPLLTATSLAAGRAEGVMKPLPTSLRPPLYPAFLAATYSVFGIENFLVVRAIQMLISLLTVVLVYLLGREVYDQRIGLLAAALYCFYPSALAYGNLLLTEVLFVFFLCGFCLCVARFYRRDSLAYLIGAGALLGLAALTRSVLWLFPPVLVLLILATWRVRWSRRLLGVAGLVAAFAIVLAPWSIRNSRLQRSFVTVDVMGGRNFMMGNYEYTPLFRAWDAIAITDDHEWHQVLLKRHPDLPTQSQGQVDKLALRYGLDFVKSHPGLTLQRDAVKMVQFWGLERELVAGMIDGLWGHYTPLTIGVLAVLIMGSFALAMLTGVAGMIAAPPADRRLHWFLLLVIAFIWGMHTLVFSHSRYHLPLMPLVLIYSASACTQARTLWRKGGWRVRLAGGVCLLLVGCWLWEITFVDGYRMLRVFGV